MRRDILALYRGRNIMVDISDPSVLSYLRKNPGQASAVLVAINFTDQPHAFLIICMVMESYPLQRMLYWQTKVWVKLLICIMWYCLLLPCLLAASNNTRRLQCSKTYTSHTSVSLPAGFRMFEMTGLLSL